MQISRAVLIAFSAIALCISVALPPHDSKDVWSYVMYGRTIAEHQANPYTNAPNAYPNDPFIERVEPGWAHVESVYGPAFTMWSAAGAVIASDNALANRMWHQGTAAICVFAFALYLKRRSALLLLCLNPAVWFMVNGGHNDLLMGVAIAVGIARKNKYIIAVAILIKASALIPAVTAFLTWRKWRPAAATASIVALAYLPFGGWNALQPLFDGSGTTSRASIWSLPQHLLGPGTWLAIAWAVCIAATIAFSQAKTSNNDTFVWEKAGWVTVVAIFTAPYVLPWYAGWVLPLAAMGSRQLQLIAGMQSLLLLGAYAAPPGSNIDNPFAPVALPLGLVIWLFLRRRMQRRQPPVTQPSSAGASQA